MLVTFVSHTQWASDKTACLFIAIPYCKELRKYMLYAILHYNNQLIDKYKSLLHFYTAFRGYLFSCISANFILCVKQVHIWTELLFAAMTAIPAHTLIFGNTSIFQIHLHSLSINGLQSVRQYISQNFKSWWRFSPQSQIPNWRRCTRRRHSKSLKYNLLWIRWHITMWLWVYKHQGTSCASI